jgi:hypothetical protein
MKKELIFADKLEDFYKIFLATFLVFGLVIFTNAFASTAFALITIYLLDGGHIYSTLLEVVADPEEIRKRYVWLVLLGSFFLNLIIHLFFTDYFFYYIFYFTIFHNMRQGLGVTFLYRIGEARSPGLIKKFYYFLTMIPFILFHFRPAIPHGGLGDGIIKPIELSLFFGSGLFQSIFEAGVVIYLLGAVLIIGYLVLKKNMRGFFSMLFYTCIYAYAFIISDNQMKSYSMLIFSHAIPYFFLMEKRINITHRYEFIKKYAFFFVGAAFMVGGAIDYYGDHLAPDYEEFESLAVALLATPLIAHFIFDAIIWKRGNERFKSFIEHH